MKKHVRKDIPQSEEELCQLLKSAIHKANQDIFLESYEMQNSKVWEQQLLRY